MDKNRMRRFYRAILGDYAYHIALVHPDELNKRLKAGYEVYLSGEDKKKRRRIPSTTWITKEQFTQFVDYVVQLFAYMGGRLYNSEDFRNERISWREVPKGTSF